MGCWCGVLLPKGGLFTESFGSVTHMWPALISFHRAVVNWSVVFDCPILGENTFQQHNCLGKEAILLIICSCTDVDKCVVVTPRLTPGWLDVWWD